MKRFEATKRPASACGRNEKQKNRNNNNNTDRERENPVSSESSLIYNSYYTLEFQQRIAIFPVRLKIHIQIYANRISIRKKKKSVGPLPNCFFIFLFIYFFFCDVRSRVISFSWLLPGSIWWYLVWTSANLCWLPLYSTSFFWFFVLTQVAPCLVYLSIVGVSSAEPTHDERRSNFNNCAVYLLYRRL